MALRVLDVLRRVVEELGRAVRHRGEAASATAGSGSQSTPTAAAPSTAASGESPMTAATGLAHVAHPVRRESG